VAVFDGGFVRTVLGLPMVVLISGHTLLRAIGAKTASRAEHLDYAVGASLTGIAGGFALNAVDFVTSAGWATWYVVVAATASAVAVRRFGAADLPPWPRLLPFRLRHAVAIALAALLTTGAYALAVRDEAKQQQLKYTEFWMLPSADGDQLSLGVRSAEVGTQRFDLEVTLDGRLLTAFHAVMAPGDIWTQQIQLDAPTKTAGNAEPTLYRLEDGRLYRHVWAIVPAR
jgi:hypothetical protein